MHDRGPASYVHGYWVGRDDDDTAVGALVAKARLTRLLEESRDAEDALAHLDRKCDLGVTWALVARAWLAEQDGEVLEQILWLERASQFGSTEAMFLLGRLEQWAGNQVLAEYWWQTAADEGHAGALAALEGRDLLTPQPPETRRALQTEARAGRLDAVIRLAILDYQEGNIAAAVELWSRAAEVGDLDAMYWLGREAHESENDVLARHWWTKASSRGHAVAKDALAELASPGAAK